MKKLLNVFLGSAFVLALAACGTEESTEEGSADAAASSDEPLSVVWYPNESGSELADAREEIGAILEETTGREVEHELTTDYAIAIESIVNDNADLAFTGAEGYIQAKERNDNIVPLVVPSGPSGTEEDALYYSWFATAVENMEQYETGEGEYSIDEFPGSNFSFVSTSSTSGFRVPTSTILNHFTETEEYADLAEEDLAESGRFFEQVMFGNTHQGSAVNLINDRADIAAFCDTCLENYVELAEGEENTPGAIYEVSEGAADPFSNLAGEQFGIISATPVLNAPFIANESTLGADVVAELQEVFASDEVANNEKIFVPEDAEEGGLFSKSADERFVVVEDEWFDPIRELSN